MLIPREKDFALNIYFVMDTFEKIVLENQKVLSS